MRNGDKVLFCLDKWDENKYKNEPLLSDDGLEFIERPDKTHYLRVWGSGFCSDYDWEGLISEVAKTNNICLVFGGNKKYTEEEYKEKYRLDLIRAMSKEV